MVKFPFTCTVDQIRQLTPQVTEIGFHSEKRLSFSPGQYLSIAVPSVTKGRDQQGNYSLSSPPQARQMEICFEHVGELSNYLGRLKPGDTFRASGPHGRFLSEPNPDRHLCYVATGSGIGPFRSMVLSHSFQNNRPLSVQCVMEAEDEEGIFYQQEIESLGFIRFIPAIRNTKAADALLKFQDFPWLETDFFLCGDRAMIREVKGILGYFGVINSQVSEEAYYDSGLAVGKVA